MAYYTVRYSYTTVRTRLEFSETDLRTVSGYDQFAVNSSQVEFLLTVCTNILVKHPPGLSPYPLRRNFVFPNSVLIVWMQGISIWVTYQIIARYTEV